MSTLNVNSIQTAGGASPVLTADIAKNSELIASSGSSLVGHIASGTGAVATTVQTKLRESVSVWDFMTAAQIADAQAGTLGFDLSTVIALAITAAKEIIFPTGSYLINSSISLPAYKNLVFQNQAILKAGTNGMTMITSSGISFFSGLQNCYLDGNGKTNVIGADLNGIRQGAPGVNYFYGLNLLTGMKLTGCFGATIQNPTISACVNPIWVVDNCASMTIANPSLDNTTGVGGTAPNTGNGIFIDHTTLGNLGVIINGGYCQGFDKGIKDTYVGTRVNGTYFEQCVTADISAESATMPNYIGTNHWGGSGAVAIKARSSDGIVVFQPILGSGARTNGLYDFDATNTNCWYYDSGNIGGKNSIGATAINIAPMGGKSGSWTPVITAYTGTITTVGAVAGVYTRIGKMVTISGSFTITTNGTGATLLQVTGMPYAASTTTVTAYSGSGSCASTNKAQMVSYSPYAAKIYIANADGTYPGADASSHSFEVTYTV